MVSRQALDLLTIAVKTDSNKPMHWEFCKRQNILDYTEKAGRKSQQCFAHDGIKEIGVIDQYKCAIFDRIEGWFDSLGIKYSVTPQVDGCMMPTNGNCFRDFRLYF